MAKVNLAVGATAPPLTDTLQVNGTVVDLTTAPSVRFLMRRVNGAITILDSPATIVTAAQGKVKYDWSSSDTASEGDYVGWWKVTFSNGTVQEFPEFSVAIDAHAPGDQVSSGEISDQARQVIPYTWDHLSNDVRYGDRFLKVRTDYVKYKLFSTVVNANAEATVYNPMILDYVAKEVALQIIPAGIEYWMNQHETVQTSGTSEGVSYPDRIAALEKTREWLVAEVARLRPEFDGIFTVRRKGNYPAVGNGTDLVTPDPQEFGAPFDEGIPKNLPWGPSF